MLVCRKKDNSSKLILIRKKNKQTKLLSSLRLFLKILSRFRNTVYTCIPDIAQLVCTGYLIKAE